MRTFDDIRAEVDRRFKPFIEQKINPGSDARDEAGEPFAREVMAESARIGLLSYSMPQELGGGGANALDWGRVLDYVGYVCDDSSFPTVLGLFSAVTNMLYESKREDVIDRYVRPMVRGDCFGAFAYSDGADPFAFRSNIRAEADHFVVEGKKFLVTGGALADVFMTYVRDENNDLEVVLVERNDPGVRVVPVSVMGVRAAGLVQLEMEGVKLPASRILVPSAGLSHAQQFLNARRALLAAGTVGRMEAMLHGCVETLHQTIRYGRPLTEMQNVQAYLGRMHVWISSSRLLLHRALEACADGTADPLWDPVVTVAKYFITERSIDVGHGCLHLLGGEGYVKEHRYERYLRDFLGMIPGAGAQDILEVDLGMTVVSQCERRLRSRS